LTTSSQGNYHPRVSLDGSKILFESVPNNNTELYIMDSDGGHIQRLTNNPGTDEYARFSPDGSKIIFNSANTSGTQIYAMDLDGGNRTQLTFSFSAALSPSFSHSGLKIVFVGVDSMGRSYLYLMNVGGGDQKRLSDSTWGAVAPAYSRDDSKIFYLIDQPGSGNTLVRRLCSFDLQTRTISILTPDSLSIGGFDLTPDGRTVVFDALIFPNWDIWIMAVDGTDLVRLTDSPDADYEPRVSARGGQIVWYAMGNRGSRLWIMGIDGSGKIQLTKGSSDDHSPCFFPNQ